MGSGVLLEGGRGGGLKRLGREAAHSLPSSAVVKDYWNYTTASHICFYGDCRETFCLYFTVEGM